MDLQQLSQRIDVLDDEPPFDLWHPEFCGDMDLVIKADGSWWYMGSPIGRLALIKLFARVLVLENNEYFLKTPVEKIRIQVEDAPFVIVDWHQLKTPQGSAIQVASNLGHTAILSEQHPLQLDNKRQDNPKLYVTLHRGLKALVHRNVYYQWVELGEEKHLQNQTQLVLKSGSDQFSLGIF